MHRALLISAIFAFGIDQLSKWLIVFQLDLINRLYMDVWPGFITFIMGWNYGVNFGILASDSPITRWILIAVAVIICAILIRWVRNDRSILNQILAGLVVGGALGNVIDRILYGAVADFLNVTCCGIRNPFSFNIADIAVFVGAIGLVIFSSEKKKS